MFELNISFQKSQLAFGPYPFPKPAGKYLTFKLLLMVANVTIALVPWTHKTCAKSVKIPNVTEKYIADPTTLTQKKRNGFEDLCPWSLAPFGCGDFEKSNFI